MQPTRVKFDRLLVGVDYSDASSRAIDRAARLPLEEDAQVTLVHVIHEDVGLSREAQSLADDEAPLLLKRAEQRLLSFSRTRGGPVPRVTTHWCHGLPFVELIREARSRAAEVVVVGRQDHRWFSDALIGSTAERVFRKSSNAVLLVSQAPRALYQRPLVAVDLSPTCVRAAELTLQAVGAEVTRVTVVHAKPPGQTDDDARAAVLACLGALGAEDRWEVIVRDGDPRRVIIDIAREESADVIVLGSHGCTSAPQELVGRVAERVVRAAQCDVLVAHALGHHFEMP